LIDVLEFICLKKIILQGYEFHGSRDPSPILLISSNSITLQGQTIEACKLLYNQNWNDCSRHFAVSVMGARVVIKYYNAVAIFCKRVVKEVKLERVLNSVLMKDLGKGL
jgi:hypothetical protein